VIPLTFGLETQLRTLKGVHGEVLGREPDGIERVFLSPEGRPWGKPTTNPMRIFRRLLLRAGIERVDAEGLELDMHAIRHTFDSPLARKGVSLVKTQRLMGHSDPKLTEAVYTHLDVEDLREAVEAIG
jgi:integrase